MTIFRRNYESEDYVADMANRLLGHLPPEEREKKRGRLETRLRFLGDSFHGEDPRIALEGDPKSSAPVRGGVNHKLHTFMRDLEPGYTTKELTQIIGSVAEELPTLPCGGMEAFEIILTRFADFRERERRWPTPIEVRESILNPDSSYFSQFPYGSVEIPDSPTDPHTPRQRDALERMNSGDWPYSDHD